MWSVLGVSDKLIDPRLAIIDERLKGINRVIAVASGKGGVGKSIISGALALSLSRRGKKIGLLDLDFTNPSTHIILGIEIGHLYPIEDRGIIPPKFSGVEYMSMMFFAGDNPSPLRGIEATNAFMEILALTRWSKLDYLIIDTPPGMGDTLLDLIKLVKRLEFILVSTPSKLSLETVKKLIFLLKDVGAPIIGVIENMKNPAYSIKGEIEALGVPYLGPLPYDPTVEGALGKPDKLLETVFGKSLRSMADLL